VKQGKAVQHGDFVQQPYSAVIRKKAGRIQVLMSREAAVYGTQIKIDKAVTLSEGSDMVEIGYRLSKLPKNYRFHFAVEFNFAGMPGGAENRYFHGNGGPFGQRFGNLSTNLDITGGTELGLYDDHLGLDVSLRTNRLTDFYAYPIETVSISEGGFELVHQSVVVQPHWRFESDESGVWETEMRLEIDTTAAVEREEKARSLLRDAARILVGEIE
ncbi:MAG: DUF1926 domain-containing protein, partial [Planctomycetaceae bacterium]|nr:DUF1926 domain-containing protein [Planctomycetaceae bacterium]